MTENKKQVQVTHDTITIQRNIDASKATVFTAWSNPEARVQWGPPSDSEAIEYLETDFRVGGMDVSRCGEKGHLDYRVETLYHDICSPARLVFSERVSHDESTLSASLVTVEIEDLDGLTKLTLTIQIASLVGDDMIAGHKKGWSAAIDNFSRVTESLK